MDLYHTIVAVIFGICLVNGVCFVIATGIVVRGWLARARFNGMKIVADEMIHGSSRHYKRENEPLPEEIKKAIDDMNTRVARERTERDRGDVYIVGARLLADAMGQACVKRGFESRDRGSEPTGSNIRVDLSAREVLNLAFLAHQGFEKMIGKFDDEQDAERASEAIWQLERHKPKDAIDERGPHAQAINRQTMIWARWPTKN